MVGGRGGCDETREDGASANVPPVAGERFSASGPPESCRERRQALQAREGGGQRFEITGRHEQRRLAVAQDIRHLPHAAGDNRAARGEVVVNFSGEK